MGNILSMFTESTIIITVGVLHTSSAGLAHAVVEGSSASALSLPVIDLNIKMYNSAHIFNPP